MSAYYNEIDPQAAAWLRELIRAGCIAPGEVDERSIEDVLPSDVRGFDQCHWFAGIGVWSYALRRSGWADDRPVWTGSCPCQPFSAAGKRVGFADERNLWPAFHHLIKECRPSVVFGEQVASSSIDPWVDLVHADLEAVGYAFGCVPFPSASVGAPHIRDRLYWVADSGGKGLEGSKRSGKRTDLQRQAVERGCEVIGMADLHSDGCNQAGQCVTQAGCDGSAGDCAACWVADTSDKRQHGRGASQTSNGRDAPRVESERLCDGGRVAHAQHNGCDRQESHQAKPNGNRENIELLDRDHFAPQGQPAPGPVNGFWSDADWLFCRDGKWRPVKPGLEPLVNGAAARMVRGGSDGPPIDADKTSEARVMRLRGYGNAINSVAAETFIRSFLESSNGLG